MRHPEPRQWDAQDQHDQPATCSSPLCHLSSLAAQQNIYLDTLFKPCTSHTAVSTTPHLASVCICNYSMYNSRRCTQCYARWQMCMPHDRNVPHRELRHIAAIHHWFGLPGTSNAYTMPHSRCNVDVRALLSKLHSYNSLLMQQLHTSAHRMKHLRPSTLARCLSPRWWFQHATVPILWTPTTRIEDPETTLIPYTALTT